MNCHVENFPLCMCHASVRWSVAMSTYSYKKDIVSFVCCEIETVDVFFAVMLKCPFVYAMVR